MTLALRIISWLGLFVTVLPSLGFLAGMVELEMAKRLMLIGTVMWFVAAPIRQKLANDRRPQT